jgi:hypothetical protein
VSDVFVSYASEDRATAASVARLLADSGFSVWWDRNILAGQVYDDVIESELARAGCVVVLWSANSVGSEWVRNEAGVAADRGVLVPVLIGGVAPPLAFRRKQTVDLSGWNGSTDHPGIRALLDGVARAIGAAPPATSFAPPAAARRSRKLMLAGIAAAALAACLALVYLAGWVPGGAPAVLEQHAPATAPLPSSTSGSTDSGSAHSPPVAAVADLASGQYYGDIVSDARGSSRSDVAVTVTALDRRKVRVTSDYPRLGAADVELTRAESAITSAGGDTVFFLDLRQTPPRLQYVTPDGAAFSGRRQ